MSGQLPPQSPEVPPRYRFRPRGDDYRAPVFPVRERREYVEPVERYDPANEPRPFEWDELRDPEVIVGGFAMFIAFVAIVVLVFLSSVA